MAAFAREGGEGMEGHVGEVLTWLVEGLGGRVWDGKEDIVHAVGAVCKECTDAVEKVAVRIGVAHLARMFCTSSNEN